MSLRPDAFHSSTNHSSLGEEWFRISGRFRDGRWIQRERPVEYLKCNYFCPHVHPHVKSMSYTALCVLLLKHLGVFEPSCVLYLRIVLVCVLWTNNWGSLLIFPKGNQPVRVSGSQRWNLQQKSFRESRLKQMLGKISETDGDWPNECLMWQPNAWFKKVQSLKDMWNVVLLWESLMPIQNYEDSPIS